MSTLCYFWRLKMYLILRLTRYGCLSCCQTHDKFNDGSRRHQLARQPRIKANRQIHYLCLWKGLSALISRLLFQTTTTLASGSSTTAPEEAAGLIADPPKLHGPAQ